MSVTCRIPVYKLEFQFTRASRPPGGHSHIRHACSWSLSPIFCVRNSLDSVWIDKIERPIRVETTVNFSLQELNSSLQSSAGESEWRFHLLWPQGRYTYTTGTFARPEDLAHAYFPFCQKSAFQFTQFSLQPKISNYIKIRSQQIFIWPLIEL